MDQSETKSAGSDAEERLKKKLEAVAPGKVDTSGDDSINASATAAAVGTMSENGNTGGRGEVSAATLARMMGLATATEVGLLEGKIDLLSTRVNSVAVRLDKILGAIEKLPNANDVDRIDINIGSLKTMIRDTVQKLGAASVFEEGEDKSLENVKIMSSGALDKPEGDSQ